MTTITAEVKNPSGNGTFRQVIRPDTRVFNGPPSSLCRDLFGAALVSVNKPVPQNEDNLKKDLEGKA